MSGKYLSSFICYTDVTTGVASYGREYTIKTNAGIYERIIIDKILILSASSIGGIQIRLSYNFMNNTSSFYMDASSNTLEFVPNGCISLKYGDSLVVSASDSEQISYLRLHTYGHTIKDDVIISIDSELYSKLNYESLEGEDISHTIRRLAGIPMMNEFVEASKRPRNIQL